MQSPEKLRQRLNDLLGPPGPDADPLELMLRSVVGMTEPMTSTVIEQYTPEMLDQALEHAALFFLTIRSDASALSTDFIGALAQINHQAAQAADTVDATAESEPTAELPQQQPPEPAVSSPASFAEPANPPVQETPQPEQPAPPANPAPPWGG